MFTPKRAGLTSFLSAFLELPSSDNSGAASCRLYLPYNVPEWIFHFSKSFSIVFLVFSELAQKLTATEEGLYSLPCPPEAYNDTLVNLSTEFTQKFLL